MNTIRRHVKTKQPPPETPALPSWLVRADTHDADIAAMYAWVNARLDELDAEFDVQQWELADKQDWGPDPTPEQMRRARWEFNLGLAKAAAHNGNFTRLRQMFPMVAEFISPPQRKRRYRIDYSFKHERLRLAIDDVNRICQIWAQPQPYGYGKWKRPDSDDIQAEAIAAKRHGLTEREVLEAMKRGMRGLYGFRYKLPTNPLI